MENERIMHHQHIPHTFQNKTFDYDTGIHYQPCIKISLFFKKRDDVSYDHFHGHWATVHADLTVAAEPFRVYKIQRYTQHHQTPETKAKVKQVGHKLLDFDGCTTMWVKSWDDYENFINSPIYEKIAGAEGDCKNFLDVDSITVFAGRDVIVFGKGIQDIDDQDGVTDYPHS